ncbi:TMV resistance protein N [Arachis hypogaea]|nr:TMV resistance protein N [Arachis hypogaea]
MGGIGKTIHAMVLYDKISYQFDACCFIQDVSTIYRNHGWDKAPTEIQKAILCQTVQEENLETKSPMGIARILHNRLCNPKIPKKVLIVLDNVDEQRQWDTLRLNPRSLGRGSRVIITTRNQHVLNVSGADTIYEVPLLNDNEALELFLRKAFRNGPPKKIISDVILEILDYAQSLPLAIEALGNDLYNMEEKLWKNALEDWRECPKENVMSVLQKSYDQVNINERRIFLDIACFFAGKRKNFIEHILSSCCGDESSRHDLAIQNIRRNSLITIRNHEIHMHNMLQELGKKIVRGEYPKEPMYWTRLWHVKDLEAVLKSDMEWNNNEAIVLDEVDVTKCRHLRIQKLFEKRNLTLLILHFQNFPELNFVPIFQTEMRYLLWHGYPFPSLQLLIWRNLVELNLPNSRVQQLWDEIQLIPNLKRMDLSNSRNLRTTPNFASCPGLVRLDLTGCINLTEVHDSIGLLRELNYLSLRECSSLSLLDFGPNCQLSSLRTLLLSGCTNLQKTPNFKALSNLRYLDLERCTSLSTMHESIGTLVTLKYLSLRGCKNLVHAPYILNGNSSLLILDLSGCMMITNLPRCRRKFAPSSCLESLMVLSPVFLEPQRILDFVGELMFFDGEWICSKLAYLNLAHCHELRRFPEASFHVLHEMKDEGKGVWELRTEVRPEQKSWPRSGSDFREIDMSQESKNWNRCFDLDGIMPLVGSLNCIYFVQFETVGLACSLIGQRVPRFWRVDQSRYAGMHVGSVIRLFAKKALCELGTMSSREKEKEKLKVVEEDKENPYHWVHDDVKTRASSYCNQESVQVLVAARFVRPGSDVCSEFLPCSGQDRVYFECKVLIQFNCAPSQLHPNSWAFLRAFEVLMNFLNVAPSLNVFFSLFQSKGVRKGLWVFLSSFPDRSLFLLYKSSFKNFKSMFVKICALEAVYPFFLDEEMIEKFPLYWCSEPLQILEADGMSEEEDCLLEFLIENFAAGECLFIPDLLKYDAENDFEGLKLYIGSKMPNLNSAKFQAYLKKKGERGGSVSGVMKEAAEDAAFSTAQAPPSPKKRKTVSENSLEVISEGDQNIAVKSVFYRQHRLHGFLPGANPHSLWSDQFPLAELVDRVSQFSMDMALTRRVGLEGMGKFIQIVASRLLCVGRTTELLGSEQQALIERAASSERLLKEREKAVSDVTAKVKEREDEVEDLRKQIKLLKKEKEDEVGRLQEQIRMLQADFKENDKVKGEMAARLNELEEEKMDMFLGGFDRAVSQVLLFAPDFDVGKLNVAKIVVNGQLANDEGVEDQDESVPHP